MEEHNYSIKSWAKNDRPREKLRMLGAENLSDSELLSILIQNGTKNRTAVDIARDILAMAKNNLHCLGKTYMKEKQKKGNATII